MDLVDQPLHRPCGGNQRACVAIHAEGAARDGEGKTQTLKIAKKICGNCKLFFKNLLHFENKYGIISVACHEHELSRVVRCMLA